MKTVLSSFAIVTLTAGFVLAQVAPPPPTFSIPAPAQQGATAGTPGRELSPNATFDTPASGTPGVAAAGSSSNASAADAGADLLLERVAQTLAQHRSITARVRYHVELFGHRTIGAGVYLQQGAGADSQTRLELKTPIGQQIATLQQVCDGKFLWQFSDFGSKPSLTRVDIRRVRQAAEQSRGATANMLRTMAIGGMPQLIDGLRRSYQYGQVEEDELDQMPVWIITGSWKPEALQEPSPELARQATAGNGLNLKKLPPHLPEQAVLYVGRDDLFPYRVEFQRRTDDEDRPEQGGANELTPIVIAEFYEVRLDAPIDARQFTYEPGKLELLDGTESFLKSLGTEPKR